MKNSRKSFNTCLAGQKEEQEIIDRQTKDRTARKIQTFYLGNLLKEIEMMNRTVTQEQEKARKKGKEKYGKILIETCFNIDQALPQNANAKVEEIPERAVKMPTAISIKIRTIFCDSYMDTKIQEKTSETKLEDSNGREESMETQYIAQEQELIVGRTEENTAATEDTETAKSDAQTINENQNLGKIFGSAHICGSLGHHAFYTKIPKVMPCDWADLREPIIENVLITTFFPKTFSDKIPAYSCSVEMLSVTTYLGFWGTK